MTQENETRLQQLEEKAAKAFQRVSLRANRQLLKIFGKAAQTPEPGLSSFNTAARRLLEAEIRHAARPRWEKLSLLHYLHSAEHVKARRNLTAEQEKLERLIRENGQTTTLAIDRAVPFAVTRAFRRQSPSL